MPLRKIDVSARVVIQRPSCANPEHDPPKHIVLEPGTYHYDCPGCGAVQIFTIDPQDRKG